MSTETNKPPDLLALVNEWFNKSQWSGTYAQADSRFVCRCCGIIWMQVLPDRVKWAKLPRTSPLFEKSETLAADPTLFTVLNEVLEKAQHDRQP